MFNHVVPEAEVEHFRRFKDMYSESRIFLTADPSHR